MTDVRRFSLSPGRISVSTVGVIPRLRTLAQDAPGISLALSLHAPTQELRMQIVPSARAWPLDKLMEAVDFFIDSQGHMQAAHRCKVLVEYVLIADVNDSEETAHALGRLLEPRSALLNVIPYNPTTVTRQYCAPSPERVQSFCEAVREHGVVTIIRQELGQDISGACGQLVVDAGGGKAGVCGNANGKADGAKDMEDLYASPRGEGKKGMKRFAIVSSAVTGATASPRPAPDHEKEEAVEGLYRGKYSLIAMTGLLVIPFALNGALR